MSRSLLHKLSKTRLSHNSINAHRMFAVVAVDSYLFLTKTMLYYVNCK